MGKSSTKTKRAPESKSAVAEPAESPAGKTRGTGMSAGKHVQMKLNLKYWIAGGVSLMTFLVYLPALWNEFVPWDDGWYIYENPHIRSFDPAFFKWAFFDYYSGNWHPLTWISHALDYAVWGLNPLGHHLTSNLLHAANTFLVVLLVVRLIETAHGSRATPPFSRPTSYDSRFTMLAAATTGLLFGIHPLHVESVAWVSERKDLLCAFFYMLSALSYIKYATDTSQRGRRMLLSLGFFVLALLSKPMAITLPVVLFILDWYPLSRIRTIKSFWKICAEKIPFIVLGLISSVLTVSAQKAGGALSTAVMTFEPLSSRAALAAKSLFSYLWKMILPLDLIALYPYPAKIAPLAPEYLVPVVLVIAITIICVLFARKQKLWLAVWGYYVITLIPVLGLVPVGLQAMADRYTYLPSLGPFILAGLAAAWVAERVSTGEKGRTRTIIGFVSAALALLILLPMTYLTFNQIRVWENCVTLWNHVIEVAPEKVPLAYGNRGVCFADLGDLNRALEDYNKAIALDKFSTGIYFERGLVFAKMHLFDNAIADYGRAIELDQFGAKSDVGREVYFLKRGIAYLEKAQQGPALSDFKQACDLGSNKGCEIMEAYTRTGLMPEIR